MTGSLAGTLEWAPLLPWPMVAVLGGAGLALLCFAAWRQGLNLGRGLAWRAGALAVLVLVLLNPRAVREDRTPRPDVAVVIVDESGSQSVGGRREAAAAALKNVQDSLARFDDLEVRVVRARPDAEESEKGTRLFRALRRAMTEVPAGRFAGAVLITDGQVHDVPGDDARARLRGPVHVLLTGASGEIDRRLVVEQAPTYGIVGGTVSIRYRVTDTVGGARTARVRLSRDGREISSAIVPVGRVDTVSVELDHAGLNVVELSVEAAEGELSTLNNRAVLSINGVRDRLRVLLISGQPHPGGRTWRNLLKSDPAVDLVHFTILRPPEKSDFTPLKELALIVFPIEELFDLRLGEFDLLVFDRFVLRNILPPSYLRNIGDYLKDGGAVLLAVGPEFAGPRSLFRSPLGDVMPGVPTGKVLEGGFKPRVTDLGRRHPVTAGLDNSNNGRPAWGRWFRQVEATARGGMVLMGGPGGTPLLILDRVGKGRIAQMMSDHIWLWARGFEGGGPQGELLRRLAHWLMKEPDLEETSLRATVRDGRLTIERRSLVAETPEVTVRAPSGATRTVTLKAKPDGTATATLDAGETGVYRIDDGGRVALAGAGALNPLEFADLSATSRALAPVARATGGGVAWIADGLPSLPSLRRTRPGRDTAGKGWMGLRQNRATVVAGVVQVPLVPALLGLGLILAGLMGAWWREGR